MEYRENYMTAKRLAEKIRQSARGKRRGLASKDEDQSYQPFEPGRYMSMVQQMFADDIGTESISSYLDSDAPTSSLRPVARDDEPTRPLSALEALSGDSGLNKDPEFMAAVEGLEEKYPGLDRREIFRVISGESGFNPQAVNKETSAAGLFQFTPEVASELGYSTEEILSMSPEEQVKVYDKYLERWDYNPRNSLGIMQAAPAFAKTRRGEDVVYDKGSKAWEQNPGWRSEGDGPITVDSINRYYRGL